MWMYFSIFDPVSKKYLENLQFYKHRVHFELLVQAYYEADSKMEVAMQHIY